MPRDKRILFLAIQEILWLVFGFVASSGIAIYTYFLFGVSYGTRGNTEGTATETQKYYDSLAEPVCVVVFFAGLAGRRRRSGSRDLGVEAGHPAIPSFQRDPDGHRVGGDPFLKGSVGQNRRPEVRVEGWAGGGGNEGETLVVVRRFLGAAHRGVERPDCGAPGERGSGNKGWNREVEREVNSRQRRVGGLHRLSKRARATSRAGAGAAATWDEEAGSWTGSV